MAYITLDQYKVVKRNKHGMYMKGFVKSLAAFRSVAHAIRFVDEHAGEFDSHAVFFCGSASQLGYLNDYLDRMRKQVVVR